MEVVQIVPQEIRKIEVLSEMNLERVFPLATSAC